MPIRKKAGVSALLLGAFALLLSACAPATESPTAVPTPEEEKVATADIIVISNSSPHVSVIDGETNTVTRTADIPDFTKWTWNDDNNYFDGVNLWLGMKHPDTNEIEVIALNLDTLEVTVRLGIGPDSRSLYIGQANEDGTLLVGKMASGQLVAIDTANFTVLETYDLPVGTDGVVCDVDVRNGPDGVSRAFIPTDKGGTVLSVNPATGEVLATLTVPAELRPFMLSASPDGTQVWVQERGTNGNTVLDAVTLENIWSAEVGTNPVKVGVHPSGQYVYATISKEGAIAVIDATTGTLVARVEIGTNPSAIFVRTTTS
jgi:YVTN family beta-propeller protein